MTGSNHPAADVARRRLTLGGDDAELVRAWSVALREEGLELQPGEPDAACDGHLLLINGGGLVPHLERLRRQREALPHAPLMVGCRGVRDVDQVLALEMGADDVFDAAASPLVVAARLRALWRRLAAVSSLPEAQAELPRELRFGGLRLLPQQRRAVLQERPVPLSEGEFEVLWLLASRAGRAVARSEILRRVRGLEDQPQDRSIDSRVYRLRAKLGDIERPRQRIRTVRNFGYAFSPQDW